MSEAEREAGRVRATAWEVIAAANERGDIGGGCGADASGVIPSAPPSSTVRPTVAPGPKFN